MSEAPDRPKMPFEEARAFRLMFGKYKAAPLEKRALDAIAETDEGLLYLDWLRGALGERCAEWQRKTLEALEVYLSDPSIEKELAAALKKGKRTGERVKTGTAQNWNQRQQQSQLWGD